MREMLERIAGHWAEDREDLVEDAGRVAEALRKYSVVSGREAPFKKEWLDAAFESLARAPPGTADGNAGHKLDAPDGGAFVLMGVALKDELHIVLGKEIDKLFGAGFVELRCDRKVFGKSAASSALDIGRDNRNVDAADNGPLLRHSFKIGFEPCHLVRIEAGVDSVFALALDDSVAVESDKVYAAKVKIVVCRAETIVKELSWICVV